MQNFVRKGCFAVSLFHPHFQKGCFTVSLFHPYFGNSCFGVSLFHGETVSLFHLVSPPKIFLIFEFSIDLKLYTQDNLQKNYSKSILFSIQNFIFH